MSDVITSLHLDQNSISNGGDLLAIDVRQVKRYIEGKPSDEFDYRVTVIAVKNGYNRYEITVSEKPNFEMSADSPVPVVFNSLTVKLYKKYNDTNSGYGLSCKAQTVMQKKA